MMRVLPIREQVIARLDALTERELEAVLRYVEVMQSVKDDDVTPQDDDENDPLVGFISGPTDMGERTEEILRDEITDRSGWTQKKD